MPMTDLEKIAKELASHLRPTTEEDYEPQRVEGGWTQMISKVAVVVKKGHGNEFWDTLRRLYIEVYK
jgi:hypothetical protein